jgi:GGDEF domain-containing protein
MGAPGKSIMTGLNSNLNKKQLQDLVMSLGWNEGFGCYTRQGFEKIVWPQIAEEAEWIIFLDVDHMHALNETHGYDAVDAMIKKSLALRATDYVASQWQSGDEFLICLTHNKGRVTSDPMALCERLADVFAENGVPATFGIAPAVSKDLIENVKPAYELVREEKKNNRRGRIYEVK